MKNRIEIELNSKKDKLLLIPSILFTFIGIWFLFNPNILSNHNLTPEIIRIINISLILFFGINSIIGLKKIFNRKIGLIIDSNGITDNSNKSSIGLIEWKDITEIRTKHILSTKFFLIDINNPEKYLEKSKSIYQSKLLKINMDSYGTPLYITSYSLNFDFKELERILQTEFERNKNAR